MSSYPDLDSSWMTSSTMRMTDVVKKRAPIWTVCQRCFVRMMPKTTFLKQCKTICCSRAWDPVFRLWTTATKAHVTASLTLKRAKKLSCNHLWAIRASMREGRERRWFAKSQHWSTRDRSNGQWKKVSDRQKRLSVLRQGSYSATIQTTYTICIKNSNLRSRMLDKTDLTVLYYQFLKDNLKSQLL